MLEHVFIPKIQDTPTSVLSCAFAAAMAAQSPAAAIGALLKTLGEAFGARRAYVYQLPPDGREFVCTTEWCAAGVEPMSEVTHGLTMQMASRWFDDGDMRSLLAIRDRAQVERVNPAYAALFEARSMHAQVLGKLMRGLSPLGVLGFDDPAPERFDELCNLMYPICAFATSAINTLNLIARIRSTGVIDKLTGAGTRMGLYQKIETLPAEVSVGLAYLDVCGLQGLNDVRGHDAGDELLVSIRQTLITEFKDDQVFRVAGDEFAVLVPGTPEKTFRAAMGRVRRRLDELNPYVAMGVAWQEHLGEVYDALVRHAWLSCTNDKRAWEAKGGTRLTEESASAARLSTTDVEGALDVEGCYRTDEFFHRASILCRHTDASRVALIALDVNYFKLYNDIFGRSAGNVLLETYARRLANAARGVHGVAGYLGGDNFCVIFPVREELSDVALAERIELEISRFDVAQGFSPACGVAVTRDARVGATILYDRALVALQEVKGSYTEHVAFYDEGRHERERENQVMLIRAQEGLERGEFTFFLQPKVDISSGRVVSAEALVRWVAGDEVISPFRFVGLMEDSGYIYALDRYVWDKVCAWQRSLVDRGIRPVPVSVNVSRVDFHFTHLDRHFKGLCERHGISPRLIGVEVTESAYARDTERVNDMIRRMQDLGFTIFIDDFGSGYSSLHMLREVSVDVLKMDKGFIDHAQIEEGVDAIISNVITMAHMMGLPVVAEGVETAEQRDALLRMGCDYVQGYLYYRPMDTESFERLLTRPDAVEHAHADDVILTELARRS